MGTEVRVIVSKCEWDYYAKCWRNGSLIFNLVYPTLEKAREIGERERAKGGSAVIIRPTYNEKDEKGAFYREWRSFDGSEFEECRWEAT